MLVRDFWHPLAKQMEKYSKLNELEEDADEKSLEGFKDVLTDEKHLIFLLEDSGQETAFMMLRKEESPTRKLGRSIKIVDLYVKEGSRGKGYGTRLVQKAREYAQENGFDYVKVSSEWENNRAREFYRKKGFEKKQIEYVDKV